jgi:hypothetical protein
MSRKAVVLVLAAVIAVAVAIPALADSGTTAKTASVRGLSTRALAKAKAALRTARGAKRNVHKAAVSATAAQGAAAAAQASAASASASAANALKQATLADEKAGGAELNSKEAKAEVASIRPHIGFAEGKVSTESESFVKLGGGPAVTLTVPTSGLVQVWGQAVVEGEGTDEAAVSLYEDGHQAEGQADCGGGVKGVLFSAESPGVPSLVGTPAMPGFAGCATLGAPGPVLFRTTAGEHTFEFRYAACLCGPPPAEKVSFSERRLVVAPLP